MKTFWFHETNRNIQEFVKPITYYELIYKWLQLKFSFFYRYRLIVENLTEILGDDTSRFINEC